MTLTPQPDRRDERLADERLRDLVEASDLLRRESWALVETDDGADSLIVRAPNDTVIASSPDWRRSAWIAECDPHLIGAIASELLALREADEWQPIETAPRDGTRILGWNFKGCTMMQWTEAEPISSDSPGLDAGWVSIDDGGAIPACPGFTTDAEGQPTHWRPLPAPPALKDPAK